MEPVDKHVDEDVRKELMMSNGKECFRGGHSENTNQGNEDRLNQMIKFYKEYAGDEYISRDGDIINFSYSRNPKGLKVSDGYCLCPLLEDGPEKISATYCYCSVVM